GGGVRVRTPALQVEQLLLGKCQHGRVFHGHVAIVDALRERFLGDRVVHQAPGDVDLPDRAPGPGNHFGGEHGAHSELLTNGDEHRVHPGRVRGGELGDVADAHDKLLAGISPDIDDITMSLAYDKEVD